MSDLDDLAGLLRDKTVDGKLKWRLDSDFRIFTKQGNNIIEVLRDITGTYSLYLRNADGVAISRNIYLQSSSHWDLIEELFNSARRDALGIDEAINDVKQRLLQL